MIASGLLLITATHARAATYYVSASGNDGNSCASAQSTSPSSQKRTISAGVACLFAGDTLYIHSGTYTGESNAINSGASTVRGGTDFAGGAITIAAYPGETVTIAVGSGSEGNAITLASATQRYLIFDGLILDGAGMGWFGGGLYLGVGAQHVRFQNGEIRNFPGQGVLTSANAGGDLQIVRNHVHHNGGNTSPQTHNIYLTSSDNLIEHNEIDHAGNFGVTIYDAVSEPSRNIVRYNDIHDNCTYRGAEIGVAGGSDNAVYGNIVHGWSSCYALDVEFASPDRTLVYSNTFVLTGGIHVGPDATNTVITNNIIRSTNNSGPGLIDDNGRASTLSNNLSSDPGFVDVVAGDFHLRSGSVAIDTAAPSRTASVDRDGVPRPQGGMPDVGAYEFVQTAALLRSPSRVSISQRATN